MSIEDLIAEEDIVVTITRGGYAKRTKTDLYRAQKRGGKGVRGAQLRQDDIVDHFFVTTTHHWMLFFTNKGRVYRAKAYELPDAGRDARGQHVANLLAIPAGRAHRGGPRPARLRRRALPGARHPQRPGEEDPAVRVRLARVRRPHRHQPARGRRGDRGPARLRGRRPAAGLAATRRSIRFTASDEALRPMGRATSGVIGMRFPEGDELLGMNVGWPKATDVLVATEGGYAKRTPGRASTQFKDVAARACSPRRSSVPWQAGRRGHGEPRGRGLRDHVQRRRDPHQCGRDQAVRRQTMGVRLMNLAEGDSVVALARNTEGMGDDAENGAHGSEDAEDTEQD